MRYKKLPAVFGAHYSDLLQVHESFFLDLLDKLGNAGTFLTRVKKGKSYIYYQLMSSGVKKEIYVGPRSEELAKAITKVRLERISLTTRGKSLVAAGAFSFDRSAGVTLRALASGGVFYAGSVLVGTNAFLVYQNALGIKWQLSDQQATRTMDADIAQFSKFKVGVPLDAQEKLKEVLESLNAEPVWNSLSPKNPPVAYRLSDSDFQIDFLSPLVGQETSNVASLPWLGVHAQPLRFLDYLIESPIRAVALSGSNSFMVNLPEPERFALHKLVVSERRSTTSFLKAGKDRAQAAALLEWAADNTPDKIREAWNDLCRKGPAWKKLVQTAVSKLPSDIRNRLTEFGIGNKLNNSTVGKPRGNH